MPEGDSVARIARRLQVLVGCSASRPPILPIFSIGGTSLTDAINSEAVAEEVVATLVGSIGLIASMPITTALASLLALRMGDRALQVEAAPAHAH